jgi:hydroxyacylglutathione hydrolase
MFCGDTLFSGGCGRMFEGTPEVFYASLQKLAALAPNTKVYCTHEYTQANMAFALSVDKQNELLIEHANWVNAKRENNEITLPSTIKKESEINPFLRCHNDLIKETIFGSKAAGATQDDVATFAMLRKLKDNF